MNELRRAAEAVVRDYRSDNHWSLEDSITEMKAALSAPDELAEARRLIAILENSGVNRDVRSEANDFLKRTEPR